MLGVIGGTGFGEFLGLRNIAGDWVTTPWGDTYLESGEFNGVPVVFLPRHGHPPRYPPHLINYRANIHALASRGVDAIVAVNAVGSVDPNLPVPSLLVPDQIIDYTWGRPQTFFEDELHHIDFSFPFEESLRGKLIAAGEGFPLYPTGVYGCTQGPRLETGAEIRRLRSDGCDVVGMTAMPEAALARECDIPYASLCVVVNAGAGINDQPIVMDEIEAVLDQGMAWVGEILSRCVLDVPLPGADLP